MSGEQELFAAAVLGRDAEEFFASELGRYVLGCAEQEERQAIEALANVHPWRRRRITQLQNEIWRARSVRLWLAELISAGKTAEAVLEAQQHD